MDRRPVATLDLHGYALSETDVAVRNFITTWQRRVPGAVVHIVTGKGRRSGGAPVVRPRVRRLLEGELGALVTEWSRDLDDGGYLVTLM